MSTFVANFELNGLEVCDVREDAAFVERRLLDRDIEAQMAATQRLVHAFVTDPEMILQELVDTAVKVCGADSAGISIERDERTDEDFYHWVATAGEYSPFLDARLPRYPSACGVCLDRGAAQRFRVGKRFFEIMGIEAPLVLDGILLPWEVEGTRGTIFVMSHSSENAFDKADVRMMETLAGFAAMAVRHRQQQRELLKQAQAGAAAQMANELAHQINNPLQGLTNLVYLASESEGHGDARDFARQAMVDLERLSSLVKELLELPATMR